MEEMAMEKTVEQLVKSSSSSSSLSPQKEGVDEIHQIVDTFSSPTPVKTKETSRIKSKEGLTELPEKYETLLELFNRMISVLRLMRLRKIAPTFRNVSTRIEILSGRKFMFMHLAQMKYILPEAVQIDKTAILNEKMKYMEPDLEISLLLDVVKDHEELMFVALRNLFSSRLRDFYIKNSEDSDIPEAELPEPFNQRTITSKSDSISRDLPTLFESDILSATQLPPSTRRFSQMAAAASKTKNTSLSTVKSACEANGEISGDFEKPQVLPNSASVIENTPTKLLVERDSVLIETPVQSTPMRPISPTGSVLTCEDGNKTTNQICKKSTSTAKKSLDFYSMGSEDTVISHHNVSVCSSNFVKLIYQIFRSANFCPITKEELVHKIVMYNLEIEDHSEVETQMEHLEKLVPDWFFKKLAISGDLLYYVKKVPDLNSVCERINVK